jgi:methionine synthase II (cobalamin-independent)
MKAAGVDSEALFDKYVQVYNDILRDRPAGLTVGLHTCRGNYRVSPLFHIKEGDGGVLRQYIFVT